MKVNIFQVAISFDEDDDVIEEELDSGGSI